MFFRRRFGRRRVYRKTQLRKRTGGRRKVSKSIKTYVRKTLHKNIENKEIIDYFANNTLQTLASGVNTGVCCRQLLPLPAQGASSNQRTGVALRIVSGIIRGSINIKPYDPMTNPVGTPLLGKIWIFRDLNISGTQAISNGSYTTYFDDFFKGSGTNLPFQGNPLDMSLPINDQKFRLLATKTFQIGATSNTSTGPVGSGGYFDNSKMSVPFYFNWGKFCKKQVKYPDYGSYPTNMNCYIVCQVVRADGTSSGSYQMAEWHAVNHIKYEDA